MEVNKRARQRAARYTPHSSPLPRNAKSSRLAFVFLSLFAATDRTPYLLPMLSGILIALGLSPLPVPFVMWGGLVPLFVFLDSGCHTKREAAWGGAIAGSIVGIALLMPLTTLRAWWWVAPDSFLWNYRELFFSLFVDTVAIAGIGGFFVLFSVAYRMSAGMRPGTELVFLPFLWVCMEYARASLIGFTWGHLGYGLYGDLLAMQYASVAGVYGLSFAVIAVNTGLAKAVAERGRYGLRAATLVLVLIYGYGTLSLQSAEITRGTEAVAVIHPALTTEALSSLEGYETMLALLEKAAGAPERPSIVVTPENAFPFFVIDRKTNLPLRYDAPGSLITGHYDRLRALGAAYPDTAFVLGMHSVHDGRRYNSIAVMQGGTIESIYEKRALLIFGERATPLFERSHVAPLTPGPKNGVLRVGSRYATGLICSEIAYPSLASSTSGSFIVNISNDSIFESPLVGEQDHVMATFRAIENRRFVLRSVKGGTSSIIDPFGRTVVRSSEPLSSEIVRGMISL